MLMAELPWLGSDADIEAAVDAALADDAWHMRHTLSALWALEALCASLLVITTFPLACDRNEGP